MQSKNWDYIFTGAGLAGLTLADALVQRPYFAGKTILLIDRDAKQHNDRTWCFWATEREPLPPVVLKTWKFCRFYAPGFEKTMDIRPYRYCMVRGIDYYRWAHRELDKFPNVRRIQARITEIDATAGLVRTESGDFQGKLIFNSAFTASAVYPNANAAYPDAPLSSWPDTGEKWAGAHLLQHFKGWQIRTEKPAFDPEVMTFMDFRVAQHDQTRFVYVLPFSETRALVEFTVFSTDLLPLTAYDAALRDYIERFLGTSKVEIESEEFGIIPMTTFPFPNTINGKVVHIGTAGGFVKASSGYAFKRTLRKTVAFAEAWIRTGRPDPAALRSPFLFRAFDSIFLKVLCNDNTFGTVVFQRLFERLPPALVLRFLDEDTTFAENLRLIGAPPALPFLRALFQQLPGLFRI